ncbi:MAG: hypothetical protein IJP95_05320 [Bacteroidales bacterium]|nr:hypothetical protein [Bacteroidales bacterium]
MQEDNNDILKDPTVEETTAENVSQQPDVTAASVPDDGQQIDDDDISQHEIEAVIAERRSHKPVKEHEDEEGSPLIEEDSPVDAYLEPDPTIYTVPYQEPIFLNRGCHNCPNSYKAIPEQELNSCCKLNSKNWMKNIRKPFNENNFGVVEVRFKNNRKEFFRLPDGLEVTEGDVVAVEGMPGHDVGIVSLTGELCRIRMKKQKLDPNSETIKRLFRRAKKSDIDKWAETIRDERQTLIRTREISNEQNLVMKINDVEMQGDHTKAIFYYTADERVDFRNLIKVLAEEFNVRVEMRQIGVRQEASKVGGIGTCGRELCCCTWLTNFQSVTTSVAKAQQIVPNPQKLAGQCGKLKCCLNFEYKVYVDAQKDFPPANTPIRTQKGLGMYKKTDVLRGVMWYAYEGENELIAIPAKSVKEIIEMNRRQEYPEKLEDYQVMLASGTAIIEEQQSAEYERELKMMADNSHDISLQNGDKKQEQHSNENNRNNNRSNNNNRRNNNRNQNQNNSQNGQNQTQNSRNRNQNNHQNRRRDNNRNQNKSNNEPKQ